MTGSSSIDRGNDKLTQTRRRRVVRVVGGLLAAFLLLAFATPWMIANTGLRNWLINQIVGIPNVAASAKQASFGWSSPLTVEQLQLTGKEDRFQLTVEQLATDRSWPRLLANSPRLGTIHIRQPDLHLKLPLGEAGERLAAMTPIFTAQIDDAGLTVHFNEDREPVIDVDGVDLTLHVEESELGEVLTLDPTKVFDRHPLTPRLCRELLQLMSPSLQDAAEIEGLFSLSLDKFRVPLAVTEGQLAEHLEIEGELALHEVSMQSDNRLLETLTKLIADVHGKTPPERTRIIKDTSVRFRARDGRLHHQDLRVGFPDIAPKLQVVSRGSVGLDESLDLHLEIPRLDPEKQIQRGPVRCDVTGTIDQPILSIKDASLVVRVPERPNPLLDVHGVDFTARIEETPAGRVVTVDPVELLRHEELNEQLAISLLQFVDPGVKYSPQLVGEISLSVDKLRIPLDMSGDRWRTELQFHGVLAIHQVTSQVNTPIRQAIVKVLADLYDKEPMKVLRVIQNNEISFELRDDRLRYTGLQLGFPDIHPELVVHSHGSVGLDETLDVYVEVPRLDQAKRQQKGRVQCHITGTVSRPELAIEDASLVVHLPDRPEPLIDVDGINIKATVEETPEGRFIAIEPLEIFHHSRLDRRLASSLLHLVEPELQYSPELTGEVSMSVDTLRIPLDQPKEQWLQNVQIHGRAEIHDASSRAETPLRRALIKLLCGLYGKEASEVNRVTHDTTIDFELRDGRMHYEGLVFGFPDIDPMLLIHSRGSLGLDQTLDVYLELPRFDKAKMKERGPVRVHLTGTVKNPRLSVKDASLVIRFDQVSEPLVDLDEIDVELSVETVDKMPVLAIAPFVVFSHEHLTAALGDRLLRLAAPTLSEIAEIEGDLSLSIESIRLPLRVTPEVFLKSAELKGRLQLHEISTTVETPLLTAMVKVLADLYGKEATQVVRVAKDDEIDFELRDGRLFHDGLRMGFPDISPQLIVTSSGSVGLDESLDLELEVPATLATLERSTNQSEAQTIRYQISGTIDLPIVVDVKKEPTESNK